MTITIRKEPAFWVALVQAVILLVLSWNQVKNGLHITTDERMAGAAAIVNAISALLLAFLMRETWLAAGVELAKAALGLLIAYGLKLTPDQMAALLGIFSVVGGGYLRAQGAPLVKPSLTNSYSAPVLTAN